MVNKVQIKKCENCDNMHNGEYGSGRFCRSSCARAFSSMINRTETNKKVSESMKKFIRSSEWELNRLNKYTTTIDKRRSSKKVVVTDYKSKKTVKLDITNGELDEYRTIYKVCEICGNSNKHSTNKAGIPNKLSIDHCHNSNVFRGLLCASCNMKLGWFENNSVAITAYMSK